MGKKDGDTEPESVESGGPRQRAELLCMHKSHPEILGKTEMSKPLLKHCSHGSVENQLWKSRAAHKDVLGIVGTGKTCWLLSEGMDLYPSLR